MHTDTQTSRATDEAVRMSREVRETATQHPMTTVLLLGGLAFALGALWKSGRQPRSRLDRLRAQMPDFDQISHYLPRKSLSRLFN